MRAEDELIRLRQENADLREQVKRIPQLEESIRQLSEQVQSLQERLMKDSHNSHLPPSSDRFARQEKTRSRHKRSGKKPGGQAGHERHHLALSSSPDQVVIHAVETCAHCQADVRAVAVRAIERRQVVDAPPARLQITEHQAERTCCPHCSAKTRAAFPDSVPAPVRDGSGIAALAVYLVAHHLLPFKRAAEILNEMMGAQMSEGTIRQLSSRGAAVLQPVEQTSASSRRGKSARMVDASSSIRSATSRVSRPIIGAAFACFSSPTLAKRSRHRSARARVSSQQGPVNVAKGVAARIFSSLLSA